MSTRSSKAARFRLRWLTLFALPFAALGVLATWWSWRTIEQSDAMKSWVEVPAIIKHVDLEIKHSKHGHPGHRDVEPTFRAVAVYEYEFGGRRYTGDRVSVDSGSDNIGRFQRNAYRELQQHFLQKKPFHCFVNPRLPNDAVLYRDLRWEMTAVLTLWATVFGAVGFGILAGSAASWWRRPRLRSAEDLAEAPWMARADWAAGKIRARGGMAVPILVVLVAWWTIAVAPLATKMSEFFQAIVSPWAVTTLAFPAVWVGLVMALVYQLLRRWKFGRSVLQLSTVPGVVGGKLEGVLRIPKMVRTSEGFRLKLSCIEITRRAEDEGGSEEVRWKDTLQVTQPMRDRLGGIIAVPVLFAIPYEAEETSLTTSRRDIEWRLEASSEVLGVDYEARFEVPVFKTSESRPDFQLDERQASQFSTAPRRELLLRGAGILKEPLAGGGVRLIFPAARYLEVAVPLTVVVTLWSAAVWLMLRVGVPIVFTIVFGLFDLFLIWWALEMWFYRSMVEARADGLTLQGGLFGIGRKHSIAADEVKKIKTSDSNVVVVLPNDKQKTISWSIEGRLARRAVVSELKAALRRKKADR